MTRKFPSEDIYEDKFSQLMKNKTVHLLANKGLICKPGWIVTSFMIVRGAGLSTGYFSTGFFSGMYLVSPLFSCVKHVFN